MAARIGGGGAVVGGVVGERLAAVLGQLAQGDAVEVVEGDVGLVAVRVALEDPVAARVVFVLRQQPELVLAAQQSVERVVAVLDAVAVSLRLGR